MKRVLLSTSVVVPLLFVMHNGCAVDESTTPTTGMGAGGSPGSTASTTSGTAGTTSSTSTGNTSTTGGSAGSATSAGAGGSTLTTGSGGAGGAATGSGGTAGAGGMATGGTAGAAGAGMGGAGGGGDCTVDGLAGGMKSEYGFVWKDSWFITGCYQKQAADCFALPGTCPGTPAGGGFEDSGSVARETFPLGCAAGRTYAVTFTLNGLTEAKVYQGGMFANPAMDVATPMAGNPTPAEDGVNNNTFYIGGTAVPSTYNVMRLRVLSPTKTEVARYYMNAFPAVMWESHRVFAISYTHTIDVPGGGFIEYTTEDSNCRAIDNCGVGAAVTNGACNASRNIPNEMNVVLPMTYGFVPGSTTTPRTLASMNVVNGATQPWHSQLNHFTITKVVAK